MSDLFLLVCVMVWMLVRFLRPEEPQKDASYDEEELVILLKDEKRDSQREKRQQPRRSRDRSSPVEKVSRGERRDSPSRPAFTKEYSGGGNAAADVTVGSPGGTRDGRALRSIIEKNTDKIAI